jgi:SNF2 family DNA or RNA helicase
MENDNALELLGMLPTLEPLSRATGHTLEQLRLTDTDRLLLDLDEDGTRFIATAICVRNGEMVNWTPSYDARKWFKRVPERDHLDGDTWKLAGTDFTAILIRHAWPADRLIFKTEAAKNLYRYLLLRFFSQNKTAVTAANFKINNIVPELPKDFIDHPELPLSGYQRTALLCQLQQSYFALFMQQGTGKTPIAIARVGYEAQQKMQAGKGMYRALIVAPKQVRMNWANEFGRFSTVPGKVVVIRGGKVRRIRGLTEAVRQEDDCAFSACVCSYEALHNTMEAFSRIPWDIMILDESHYIKAPNSKRSKNSRNIRDLADRRLILTGTPIANNPMDLWSQLEFLDSGLSGFMSYKVFRTFHGVYEKSKGGFEKLVALQNVPLIKERLARISFSITKAEANLGLPEKTWDVYEVTMQPKQRKLYVDLAEAMIAAIEEELARAAAEGRVITAEHVLTRLLRLAQITSGHVRWDAQHGEDGSTMNNPRVEQIPGGNPKVQAILDIHREDTEADPKSKRIIWCHFVEDIRVVSEALAKEGINHVSYHPLTHPKYRVKEVHEAARIFNQDKDVTIFLGNPASAAEGLNLLGYDPANPSDSDMYCDHEIFMSCDWSAVKRSQAEDRAHRRGTRRNVRITDLTVPGTIDEEIRKRVVGKRKMAMEIQDIREMMSRLVESELEEDE